MILIIETHKPVAPKPATALPKIKMFTLGLTAHKRLPTSKMMILVMKTILGGENVRTRPKKSMNAA